MSVLNETGVKVKIRHDDSIHSGTCQSSEGNCSVRIMLVLLSLVPSLPHPDFISQLQRKIREVNLPQFFFFFHGQAL